MYPRNAASPERIAIGPVVQISDGAVQTSGCTVRIAPFGGAEGDGAGTTAYSTDGVVLYTPTQAETNYTSFILIAKKSGCIPASVTIVTTASATAGYAVCADTQKVDLNTIKTQAVTCGAGVTIRADVGHAGSPGAANGALTTNGTKCNQTVDLTAGQSIACSDKTGFALTSAYDPAKTAAQSSSLSAVATKIDSIKIDTSAVAAVDFGALTAAVGALDASAISDLAADLAVVDGIVDSILADTSAIVAKLPSKAFLTGTTNSDGDIQANEATGNFPGSVAAVVDKSGFASSSSLSAVATKIDSIKIDTSAVAAVDFGALTSAIASMDTSALSALTEVLGSLDTSALAAIPTASEIRAEMETTGGQLERVHRRLFGKVTMGGGVLKVYDDTGALVVTTQILSDDGTTQTQGAAT